MRQLRYFLKDSIRKTIDFRLTDQSRGVPPPPVQKPVAEGARTVELVLPDRFAGIPALPLAEAIRKRESRRAFAAAPLSLEELSFLLWASQGVRQVVGEKTALRTVPSAGARHALETYVLAFRVEGVEEGVYRYLPLDHRLVFEFAEEELAKKVTGACFGQAFAGAAAATFVWTTIPYRMEWRYGHAAHKVIALDAGHACQNLYLACEAIGAGTCAIGAYDQEEMDSLLRVDGQDEFTVYIAPVGKRRA
jgi:SagB-type dehydrogenase family enzyme